MQAKKLKSEKCTFFLLEISPAVVDILALSYVHTRQKRRVWQTINRIIKGDRQRWPAAHKVITAEYRSCAVYTLHAPR